MVRSGLFAVLALLSLFACSEDRQSGTVSAASDQDKKPLIIAHRGASGALPEHTLPAFQQAIEMGADFIEPDLVMTKDGVLIVRHDRYLSTTTNVADLPQFADRKRTQMTLSGPKSDWWAEDFTLSEIKALKARQPRGSRDQSYNDEFDIPSFEDVLGLVVNEAKQGRVVGVYPETKAPGHHAARGLAMADPLLTALKSAGVDQHNIPVFIQSFEKPILLELAGKTDYPLVQLLTGSTASRLTGREPMLKDVSVNAVGVNKTMLFDDGGRANNFVKKAHNHGLAVHVWTVRDDEVPGNYENVDEELRALFDQGIDGVFTDFPGTAVKFRKGYQLKE